MIDVGDSGTDIIYCRYDKPDDKPGSVQGVMSLINPLSKLLADNARYLGVRVRRGGETFCFCLAQNLTRLRGRPLKMTIFVCFLAQDPNEILFLGK